MENPEVTAEVAVSIAEAAGTTRIDITEDLPSAADDNIFVNTGRPKCGTNKHDINVGFALALLFALLLRSLHHNLILRYVASEKVAREQV